MNLLPSSALPNINLQDLNEPQREAASYGEGPLLILAGAGTGKTRVITYRIARLLECGVKPWNILAVTFTNKAAQEMRDRIFTLTRGTGSGMWVSTFHSFCAQVLRTEGSRFGLDRNFSIYDEDDQKRVLKEAIKELQLDEKKLSLGSIAGRISREKDQLMDADSFAISASISGDPHKELLASIYTLYQKKMNQSMALDFGDLIMKVVQFLHQDASLREKMQERFQYVMVDEYQDTNHAQYVLTKMIAAKYKNICVVGDDDQSIYSWRGADIKNILEFEKDYPKVKVVKLEQNYRSTQAILNAAWKMVQNNEQRKEKKLWTVRESNDSVRVECFENEIREAGWVVSQVREIQAAKRIPYSHFSVFYRTNAQSRVLEDAFRMAQVPYRLVGNVRFYERAEVKDLLGYLKIIVNPKDDLSLKRILNTPPRGIGKVTFESIEKFAAGKSIPLFTALKDPDLISLFSPRMKELICKFCNMIDGWIAHRDETPVFTLLKSILDETGYLNLLKEEAKTDMESAGRLDNVQELMNAVQEFEDRSNEKKAASYLEQVALITELDTGMKQKESVTLMTVHLAKGLEFPVVFLTGLEEGLFPLGDAQFSQEELEEERRIAYVGMTRAKDELYLTSSASRKLFGQTHWNLPSRFIEEAGLAALKPEQRTAIPFQIRDQNFEKTNESLNEGDRVLHADFGRGRVTKVSGSGEDLKVVVQFESGAWKKLLVKYAPLRRI